ncbi:MAG: hypothetical protein KGI70_00400 [Patescibacteria group bacterium]|nr:hypothetical protein [Patescibacteria group bacterium]
MARVDISSGLRIRRRRRRAWALAGVALVLIGLVTGAAAFSHAPFLRITRIEIVGAQTVASSTIMDTVQQQLSGSYFFIFARDNIFLYPKRGIDNALLFLYPQLKSVDVHAGDFNSIAVSVVERAPKALWCGSGPGVGACSYVDEDGVVYAQAPDFNMPLYVEYLGVATGTPVSDSALQFLTSEQFHSLAALIDALTTPENQVHTVTVDDVGDVRAYFQNNFILIFSLGDEGGDIYERYKLALQSDPFKNHTIADFEYLDLRFGDKLYYKLK